MRVYVDSRPKHLADVPAFVQRLERLGFDGVTMAEMTTPPILSCTMAAAATTRLRMATWIHVAFPRSPMVTAYSAWSIQDLAKGRFELGLGTQVKGHMERRYSVPYSPPLPRMRDYVNALHAIFDCWQNKTPLNFHSEHYTHTLMIPLFTPEPLTVPRPPIYTSCMNTGMAGLAGEICDGVFFGDPVTNRWVRERLVPAFYAGARKMGRDPKSVDISNGSFVGVGSTPEEIKRAREAIRSRIAFYGSTPTYRPIFEYHGWGEVTARLHPMSKEGKWVEMAKLITDEMVENFSVVGRYEELPDLIKDRFGSYAKRVHLGYPDWTFGDTDERVKKLVAAIQQI
ncbi:MAG: TIGR03617 family F420-dependent LLM class oxidoreductase [Candidatus Rokubacteria bacterium]|nr:TIGR03617 family F420-dependent LLM class oxidoreductase [Candidatus Rokubacteria bacterium]